ncbi:hypothetical protein GA0115242_10696 [Streptomyces sp. SolWspMP-5a-2]|nr:hypothetical protein GA0115242_10696 [Streptomyces sp. SolWspMP-5a-2]
MTAGQQEQRLDDRADPVVRHGERMRAGFVDEGAQSLVQVEMEALDPVGQLRAGEPESGADRHQQPLREDGGRPAGAAPEPCRSGPAREQRLERLPVHLTESRPETAPGGLVHLPRDPGGEPPYGPAGRPVHGGEPLRDPQTAQIQVRREHLVPPQTAGHLARERLPHLAEHPHHPGAPGVDIGERALRNPEALPQQPGPTRRKPTEPHVRRKTGVGRKRQVIRKTQVSRERQRSGKGWMGRESWLVREGRMGRES